MIECRGTDLDQVVQLVNEARATEADGRSERRVEQRYTYFRPLAVCVETAAGLKSTSAFGRDISLSGLGLLTASPVDRGRCLLRFGGENGTKAEVSAEVMWCCPCGEGWYLAGARFLRDRD